jgi:hypothetical protein
MISQSADAGLGSVMVATSNDGGHDPDFWAKIVTDRLVSISGNADPHVRQQAEAFRQQVYEVVLRGINSAIASDRTTLSVILRRQGHNQMADLLKEL